jgi:hypothetical protein
MDPGATRRRSARWPRLGFALVAASVAACSYRPLPLLLPRGGIGGAAGGGVGGSSAAGGASGAGGSAGAVDAGPGGRCGAGCASGQTCAATPYPAPLRFGAGLITVADRRSVAAGDLDGDGNLDLAVVGAGAGSDVALLFGNGDGTFRGPVRAGGGRPGAQLADITIADMNGDGIADLVMVDRNAPSLDVMRGHGDGTFFAPQSLGLSFAVVDFALGDVNGDGKQDVVALTEAPPSPTGGRRVAAMLGRADGIVGASRAPIDVDGRIGSLALGDADRDGRLDIVLAQEHAQAVPVLHGNGDGTFGPAPTAPDGTTFPVQVALADVNRDAVDDLVIVGDEWAAARLANPDGTFQAPQFVGVTEALGGVTIADWSGDGWPDLAFAASGSPMVFLHPSQGDGTFAFPVVLAADGTPATVFVADLNHDGHPDLVVPNTTNIDVFLAGGGAGGGDFVGTASFPATAPASGVAAADLDEDGRLDLVTTEQVVLLGMGNGAFGELAGSPAASSIEPGAVATADFDRDGHVDLVSVRANLGGYAQIFRGDGRGHFSASIVADSGGANPSALAVADLNGDGFPDVVLLDRQGIVTADLNDGKGGVTEGQTFDTGATTGGASAVAAGDLDGDGHVDLAVANGYSQTVGILRGHGDGTFAPASLVSLNGDRAQVLMAAAVAIADLDGDGRGDLVVGVGRALPANVAFLDGQVIVARGRGGGMFDLLRATTTPIYPNAVAVADVDGDGRLDVVATGAQANDVTVLPGNGDGSLGAPRTYPTATMPAGLATGDFNGDGIGDVAIACSKSFQITLLLSTGVYQCR